jgi:hypothetical protein
MRSLVRFSTVAAVTVLAACAANPPPRPVARPAPMPSPAQTADVVIYPARGQTPEQLDRDRYECHNWAVQQTGFDPSRPGIAPQYRVHVVPGGPPPGSSVLAGGVIGALVGASVSNPWHAGSGALVGAVAGATIGAVADSSREEANRAAMDRAEAQAAAANGAVHERALSYRRAISACLEGRGYTVK